jgi:hypothetical protein
VAVLREYVFTAYMITMLIHHTSICFVDKYFCAAWSKLIYWWSDLLSVDENCFSCSYNQGFVKTHFLAWIAQCKVTVPNPPLHLTNHKKCCILPLILISVTNHSQELVKMISINILTHYFMSMYVWVLCFVIWCPFHFPLSDFTYRNQHNAWGALFLLFLVLVSN